MGVDRIDNILMILGVSRKMNEEQKEIVTREMIQGFNDAATEAETLVTGGQSVQNPWPIIGGVANVVCKSEEIIMPSNGKIGDRILLTKPLGTQLAVNAFQWKNENKAQNLDLIKDTLSLD